MKKIGTFLQGLKSTNEQRDFQRNKKGTLLENKLN